MCISLPGKVLAIDGQAAEVETAGARRKVLLAVPDAQVGTWVLIHSGIAIAQLDPGAAQDALQLLSQLENANTGR